MGFCNDLRVLKPQLHSHDSSHDSPIHPDLSQMVKSGCIGMRWDGKKDAPTVSGRFIYGSTTTHDGSARIYHGGATNAHHASTIRYCVRMIQAGRATVVSQSTRKVHDLVIAM